MLNYESDSRGRWFILWFCLLWSLYTHQWNGHFIAGMILAEASNVGMLDRFQRSRLSTAINATLALFMVYFMFHGKYFYGKETFEFVRTLQVGKDGKHGVQDYFWEENATMCVVSFIVLFIVETKPFLQRFFSHRLFVFLGRISFALYLFHHTFMASTLHWLKTMIPFDTTINATILIALSTVLLCLVSEVLTIWIDHPSITFGRWIETKVLNDDWTVMDIAYSIPFWPRGIVSFAFHQTKLTIKSFIQLFSIFSNLKGTQLP